MGHESLNYEQTLERLLGLINAPVQVELSGAEYGYRAAAGSARRRPRHPRRRHRRHDHRR
jgi:hypothetical protein